MANINKIRLSGQTYNIEDSNAPKTVELTQAQYDALAVKDPNTFYIITDAQGADLSQYYTSAQTESAITQAVSGKQDTLVSGTNIKTINNESILGSGNIEIQGGSDINVVQTTGTSTADVMSQDAVTNAFNTYTVKADSDNGEVRYWSWKTPSYPNGGAGGTIIKNFSINGRCPLTQTNGSNSYIDKFSLVETSAITTSITSSSTDSQVPSAKAVYDAIQEGGGSSYTAGDGIDITNDVISVTGKVDTTAFTAHTADTVIHVTSAEKAAWNAKSDFSGSYNDLTDKPTIPTVPTSNTAFTNDAGYITSDAISGKVDTTTYNTYTAATYTAIAGKQDNLVSGTNIKTINNESILGEGNITIESGGGKAINAGTNISVTTGETADTINCTLPITADTNTNAPKIKIGSDYSLLTSNSSVSPYSITKAHSNILFGNGNTVFNNDGSGGEISYNFLLGVQNSVQAVGFYKPTSTYNMFYGTRNTTQSSYGFAFGNYNTFSKGHQFTVGDYHTPKNDYETNFGKYSISVSPSTAFGNSGNTLFSVANGYNTANTHNALEIRQNGDIYIADTNDTSTTNYYEKPMIKLQDALGGTVDTEITSASTNPVTSAAIYNQFGGLKLVKLTQSEYDALSTKDSNTLYVIVN